MLTDRALLAAGKQQRYATQFAIRNGEQQLSPTEDMDHVDQRRDAVGLPPLADYRCAMRVFYGPSGR
jgi:hypothetical protein